MKDPSLDGGRPATYLLIQLMSKVLSMVITKGYITSRL